MNVKDLKQLDEDASMDINIMVRFREMVICGSIADCYESNKDHYGWNEDTPVDKVIELYLEQYNFIETDDVYDNIASITIDSIEE